MPFRKKKVKQKDGSVLEVDERFLTHFLAETKAEADDTYKQYKSTLALLASKYASYTGLDEDDLIQEGVIGLARAKRDFEEDRSDTFHTFAIYKIKDAMREYSSKQADDISIPQYIKEAARLVIKLRRVMEMAGLVKTNDFASIWGHSAACDQKSEVIKDITSIRQTIRNLADRSCTSVNQLLERAEMYPAEMAELDYHPVTGEIAASSDGVEESLIQKLVAGKAVSKLKEILPKEDYELIYAHYSEGKTVRELAPLLGIKASSVTIRIHNVVKELQKKKEQIYML